MKRQSTVSHHLFHIAFSWTAVYNQVNTIYMYIYVLIASVLQITQESFKRVINVNVAQSHVQICQTKYPSHMYLVFISNVHVLEVFC